MGTAICKPNPPSATLGAFETNEQIIISVPVVVINSRPFLISPAWLGHYRVLQGSLPSADRGHQP